MLLDEVIQLAYLLVDMSAWIVRISPS